MLLIVVVTVLGDFVGDVFGTDAFPGEYQFSPRCAQLRAVPRGGAGVRPLRDGDHLDRGLWARLCEVRAQARQ